MKWDRKILGRLGPLKCAEPVDFKTISLAASDVEQISDPAVHGTLPVKDVTYQYDWTTHY